MNALKIERDATTGKVTMTPMALNPKTYFADIQTLCGGYIERAWTAKGERTKKGSNAALELWANEDGIALGLTPTVQLEDPVMGRSAPLFGTLVLVAVGKAYGKPRDMTEKEKESVMLLDDDRRVVRISPTQELPIPSLRMGLD